MNQNRIEGRWPQARGGIKSQWGRLTDAPPSRIEVHQDLQHGQIQSSYGADHAGRLVRDRENHHAPAVDENIRRIAREHAFLIGR